MNQFRQIKSAGPCLIDDSALAGSIGVRDAEAVEPIMLTQDALSTLQFDTRMALEVLSIAEQALVDSRPLRDRLFGDHASRWIIEANLNYASETIGRFDALQDMNGAYRFIEYNSGLCGGGFAADEIASGISIDALRAMSGGHAQWRYEKCGALFVEAIEAATVARTGTARPTLGVIIPDGERGDALLADPEILLLLTMYAEMVGPAHVVRLSDLRSDGRRLRGVEGPIHAALVGDWLTTIAACARNHPIWECDQLPGTWMCNALGASIYRGGKQMFALLSDERYGLPFTGLQREWIKAHIPSTRMLDVAMVDDADALVRNREQLVIKTCFASGGYGVVPGWATSEGDWIRALDHGRTDIAIVQERITPRARRGRARGGSEGSNDICPFVWRGKTLGGMISRFSASALHNISAGSGLPVPVFIQS